MSQATGRGEYPIAAVSKLTGVSCHALRVWERRYGFPDPQRSPSGHRRYAHEQVGVLRQLAKLAHSGRPIGELIGDYQAGRLEIRAPAGARASDRGASSQVVDRLLAGDMPGAEAILDRQAERSTPIDLVERVIEPALIDIGERWFRRECDIFQEHCAVAALFGRLGRLLDQARRANLRPLRTVLVGAIQGDRHEGGVLMVSLALELASWRALPMGVDLPAREYRKAIDTWRPDALALSFVLSRNINKRFEELSEIRDVPIFVGGRSIVNHQGLARRHGLIPLVGSLSASTEQLRAGLDAWRRDQVPQADPPQPG